MTNVDIRTKVGEVPSQFFEINQLLQVIDKGARDSTIKDLFDKLKVTDRSIVNYIENRLYYTFATILLKGNMPPGVCERTIMCIDVVFSKSEMKKLDVFKSIYPLICCQIFDAEKCCLSKAASEELISAVMHCLKTMIEKSANAVLLGIYNKDCTKILSQGILLACQVARFDKCIRNRILALEFLLAASQYSKEIVPVELVEETFIHFIPGLIISCSKIIFDSPKTHHKIVQLAVRVWGQVLRLTLRDLPNEQPYLKDVDIVRSWLQRPSSDIPEENPLHVLQKPERSTRWKIAAGKALGKIIFPSPERPQHPHVLVRLEMVAVHWYLVATCAESLGQYSANALDCLIALSLDEEESVKSMTTAALSKLSHEKVLSMSQERLPWVISRLSRSLISGDKKEAGHYLLLLNGYLKILLKKDATPRFLSSPVHLRSLAAALSCAASLEVSPQLLNEHANAVDLVNCPEWKCFEKVNSKGVEHLREVCCSIEAALPQLFEVLSDPVIPGNLVVLNYIVENSYSITPTLRDSLLTYNLKVNYAEPILLGSTPKEKQTRLLKVALAMEGIGLLSKKISAEDIDRLMLRALCPVVERLGSSFTVITVTTAATIELLADACHLDGVSSLLQHYIDYITDQVCRNLRRRTPDVLSAAHCVTKLCPQEALPSLSHIVRQVLRCSSEKLQLGQMTPYLGVFLLFVECAAANPDECASSDGAPKVVEPGELSAVQRLLNFVKNEKSKKTDEEVCNSEEESEINGDSVNEEEPYKVEKKEQLPTAVSLCIVIVRRCLHCIASRNLSIALSALNIVRIGLQVVSPWENELLPLVHETWSPLVRKFNARSDFLVLHRSFLLLTTLAELAKDFIRFRTLKEVLPGIRDTLVQLATGSKDVGKTSAYNTTQRFKLQKVVLSRLGRLTVDLNLRERETNWVVEAAIPYLSAKQPTPLQEKTVKLFKDVLRHDPYLVQYRLQSLAASKECSKNVQKVFSVTNS